MISRSSWGLRPNSRFRLSDHCIGWFRLKAKRTLISGNLTQLLKMAIFLWEKPLFLWPFSIAMLNYQRVVFWYQWDYLLTHQLRIDFFCRVSGRLAMQTECWPVNNGCSPTITHFQQCLSQRLRQFRPEDPKTEDIHDTTTMDLWAITTVRPKTFSWMEVSRYETI